MYQKPCIVYEDCDLCVKEGGEGDKEGRSRRKEREGEKVRVHQAVLGWSRCCLTNQVLETFARIRGRTLTSIPENERVGVNVWGTVSHSLDAGRC